MDITSYQTLTLSRNSELSMVTVDGDMLGLDLLQKRHLTVKTTTWLYLQYKYNLESTIQHKSGEILW